ncbi:protein adenylyltransferase SelO [Evansella tamaricis]|uniref:Protein nucleotidyltransferase YdiU n=1 Tax=Evansella tamaricis TaxID=2069301 RepID=A0ABS6JEL3_9BACI|nr:YdiU family protein [Evansella tamaricis]MBU9712031.1 YdiU family protein [Evansella tamaricis]
MTSNVEWNLDNSYARLPDKFYSQIDPNLVDSPELVILNETLARSLGLDPTLLRTEEAIEVFAGNRIPEGGIALAQAYAGHQFGHFTMLGDGRAMLHGEQITPTGERFDIQLKGSGRTPYSRGGDGRASLGPMLREYIISESMHALNIPTTRSLAVVTTGEPVYRETELPGAVLTRVAASHLRVGTFEFAVRYGTGEELRALADYTIERHYPSVTSTNKNRYIVFLQEVIKRQASLISKWQLVGFIHGVMNTDNMTICGETIDYGPCAFMDKYDPETVFSSIDRDGRYAYGNQPYIGGWNLARFAETLVPLLHEDQDEAVKLAQNELSKYSDLYREYWMSGMRAKLGLFHGKGGAGDGDEVIIDGLLSLMKKYHADFTNTFRSLTMDELDGKEMELFKAPEFTEWHDLWQGRLSEQEETTEDSYELMRRSNPTVIPRNHRVEEALDAAVENEDFTVLENLLAALSNPYDYSKVQREYTYPPDPKVCAGYRTYCGT